jgi:peptidyl-prolyl cis-trans isomerase SurA
LTSDQTTQSTTAAAPAKSSKKKDKSAQASMKPGKKEKIRFGKAPQETLPDKPTAQTEDAGALPQTASNANEPENPLEAAPKEKKTRFSDRAREPKQPKGKTITEQRRDKMTPEAPDAAEVADRQTQSAPLGLAGDTASKKKKKQTSTTGEKTRISDRKKPAETGPAPEPTPAPTVPGAPAPSQQPAQPLAPQPAQTTPQQ